MALEGQCRRRQQVLNISRHDERHAKGIQQHAAGEMGQATQQGINHALVQPHKPRHSSDFLFLREAFPLQYLIGVAYGLHRQPLHPHGMPVDRKDVDVYAALPEYLVVTVVLVEYRPAVAQFGILEEIIRVGLPALQGHCARQLLRHHLKQPQIIPAQHLHVHIVVPGNETVVARGSQQRAGDEPVAYVMLLADAVQLKQQLQHAQLLPPQL